MAGKGSLWSTSEVECLLEIWSNESIQGQLDKTHRNAEIFGRISAYLSSHGHQRSLDQCRDKVKKLRLQYQKVRDSLRRSGSSSEEKEKFQWYEAVDQIIGHKPTSEPNVIQSCPGPDPVPDTMTEMTEDVLCGEYAVMLANASSIFHALIHCPL